MLHELTTHARAEDEERAARGGGAVAGRVMKGAAGRNEGAAFGYSCSVRFPCMLVNITMILLSMGICLPIICPARKRRMEAFDQDMRELVRDLNSRFTERLPFLTQSFLVKTQCTYQDSFFLTGSRSLSRPKRRRN